MQRMPHPASGMTPDRLNPPGARNTDSCLPLHPAGDVVHDYNTVGPAPGDIRFRWAHGSIPAAKNSDPRVQVIRYNEDTFCMRENICVDWRGPFTYLLFGNKGCLLIDAGATDNPAWYPLRSTVEASIAQWQAIRRRADVPLTVALTSAENAAQNGGLSQFAGRANTTIVPRALPAMQAFYGMGGKVANPPGQIGQIGQLGQIDLGGRVLDVIPTPGTHRDGVSFYDRYTHLLFTGDLLFPGRIAIANERDYIASLDRLQRWKSAHPVKWVMGGHVDMQFLPGRVYERFATFKPYERELQMGPDQIDEAASCAREIAGKQTVLGRKNFWMRQGVGPDEEPDSLPAGTPDVQGPRPV